MQKAPPATYAPAFAACGRRYGCPGSAASARAASGSTRPQVLQQDAGPWVHAEIGGAGPGGDLSLSLVRPEPGPRGQDPLLRPLDLPRLGHRRGPMDRPAPQPRALRHRAADLLGPHPRHRDDVLPTCRRYGLGVLSYSPLADGWLSGRYRQDATEGPASVARQRLANRFDLDLPDNQRKLEAADQLAQLADDAGISLIELRAQMRGRSMVSTWTKSTARMPRACAVRNCFHVDPFRRVRDRSRHHAGSATPWRLRSGGRA